MDLGDGVRELSPQLKVKLHKKQEQDQGGGTVRG